VTIATAARGGEASWNKTRSPSPLPADEHFFGLGETLWLGRSFAALSNVTRVRGGASAAGEGKPRDEVSRTERRVG